MVYENKSFIVSMQLAVIYQIVWKNFLSFAIVFCFLLWVDDVRQYIALLKYKMGVNRRTLTISFPKHQKPEQDVDCYPSQVYLTPTEYEPFLNQQK